MVSRPPRASKVTFVPAADAPLNVFLTGCASGIGRDLADALVAAGHRIWATDVAIERLREHARAWPSDRSACAPLDVRDAAAWESSYAAAIERLGAIDVHVNVAGYLRPGWLRSLPLNELDRHIDVNLRGVAYGTAVAARHMSERRRGHIINVASLAGIAPIPGIAIYSATKHAVRGLSLAAAAELREFGVAVTTICPDAVETPMLELQVDHEEAALTFSGARPLTTAQVVAAILRALDSRKLEVAMPRRRALVARLAGLFPMSMQLLRGRLARRGAHRQAERRARRRASEG